MNTKFFQSMLFALALIFISHPTNVTADEPVQQDQAVHQDDIDIVNDKFVDEEVEGKGKVSDAKSDKHIDVAAIEKEINSSNEDSIKKLAEKMYPEASKEKGFDSDKVVGDIRKEIEKNPESLANLDAFAATIRKTYYDNHMKNLKSWKHEIEKSTDLSPVEKAEQLNELNKEIDKLKKKAADPHANVNSVIESLINKWNGWPDGPLVKAMQVYVIKKHGLYNSSLDQYKDTPLDEYKAHVETVGLVMDAMKNLTYRTLEENGITHLTLYRGLKLKKEMPGKIHSHRLSGLSSFTLSLDTAKGFSYPEPGMYGYVLAKTFPIDRILSFWGTGLGTQYELEVVVLGPQDELDEFYVIKPKHENYDENHTQPGGHGKKPKFHKWVDYGHQKAVDKKDLQLQEDKVKEESTTSITTEAKQAPQSGVVAFILEVFKAIFTFIKDVVSQLIAFIKSLF